MFFIVSKIKTHFIAAAIKASVLLLFLYEPSLAFKIKGQGGCRGFDVPVFKTIAVTWPKIYLV